MRLVLHFEPTRGEPFTREVEPGDLLVVYTDGVTEAAKPAGEEAPLAYTRTV